MDTEKHTRRHTQRRFIYGFSAFIIRTHIVRLRSFFVSTTKKQMDAAVRGQKSVVVVAVVIAAFVVSCSIYFSFFMIWFRSHIKYTDDNDENYSINSSMTGERSFCVMSSLACCFSCDLAISSFRSRSSHLSFSFIFRSE